MKKYILNERREPVPCDDLHAWGRWLEGADSKWQSARDEVGDILVSTVFLGLDHSFTGGPPVLWETMVFGGALDGEQERYTSEAAALRGHALILARVKESVEQP